MDAFCCSFVNKLYFCDVLKQYQHTIFTKHTIILYLLINF